MSRDSLGTESGNGELSLLLLLNSDAANSSATPVVASVLIEGDGTSPVGSGPLKLMTSECSEPR